LVYISIREIRLNP